VTFVAYRVSDVCCSGTIKMELIQLSKHCYCSDFDRDYDRPRLGYIVQGDCAVMIDAGNSASHYQSFLDALTQHQLPKPSLLILTHWHWDHVFGLHACDFKSLATLDTQAKLMQMQTWTWDDQAMARRLETGEDIEFCDIYMRKEYPDRSAIHVALATNTFRGSHTLKCHQLKIDVVAIDNDHSEDACVVLIKDDKVLFLGDIYTENYHAGPAHYTVEKLSSLITSLKALDFEIAIHGHDQLRSKDELLLELTTSLNQLT